MSASSAPPASASPEAGGHPQSLSCLCCGRPAERVRRGWSDACYTRWLRAGRPAGGPPPPTMLNTPAEATARREEYALLTRVHGLAQWEAAAVLGVSEKTVQRYAAHARREVAS